MKSTKTTQRMLEATNMKIKHITWYVKSSVSGSASFFNTNKLYQTTNKICSLWKRKESVFCFTKYCYRITNISVACKYNNALTIQLWFQYSLNMYCTYSTYWISCTLRYAIIPATNIRHRRSVHYVTGHRLQQGFHLHSVHLKSIYLLWSKIVHYSTVTWVQ
jgi:hypothetical protein